VLNQRLGSGGLAWYLLRPPSARKWANSPKCPPLRPAEYGEVNRSTPFVWAASCTEHALGLLSSCKLLGDRRSTALVQAKLLDRVEDPLAMRDRGWPRLGKRERQTRNPVIPCTFPDRPAPGGRSHRSRSSARGLGPLCNHSRSKSHPVSAHCEESHSSIFLLLLLFPSFVSPFICLFCGPNARVSDCLFRDSDHEFGTPYPLSLGPAVT